jgi:hydrogenase/urease accessory protein HupE
MKHLLPPAFTVLISTAGTAWGCHTAGMPDTEVIIASTLAFTLSFGAAFVAVLLASRPRQVQRDLAR